MLSLSLSLSSVAVAQSLGDCPTDSYPSPGDGSGVCSLHGESVCGLSGTKLTCDIGRRVTREVEWR